MQRVVSVCSTVAALFFIAFVSTGFWHGTVFFVGQVATRSSFPEFLQTGNAYANSRTGHIFRANVASVQIKLACAYGIDETSPGADCTFKVGMEYPQNTFTRVKWGGSDSIVVTAGTASNLSDAINVSVPNGATAWFWVWQNNSNGVLASLDSTGSPNTFMNDAIECSASVLADKSLGGTFTNTCSGDKPMSPLAIVATIAQPAICFTGDSRATATGDTNDATGDYGEVARSIGPSFGYINLAVGGSTTVDFVNNHSIRGPIGNTYCTHIIHEGGSNNLIHLSSNPATIEGQLQAIWALFPTKKNYQTTIMGETTSTDSWATLVNQTIAVGYPESARETVNTWILTNPSGIVGSFNNASAVDDVSSPGKWKVDGTPFKYTGDGLHESNFGYLQIPANNLIPSSAFVWP